MVGFVFSHYVDKICHWPYPDDDFFFSRVNCSFYFKIGACRHGDRCSRLHNKPTFSQVKIPSEISPKILCLCCNTDTTQICTIVKRSKQAKLEVDVITNCINYPIIKESCLTAKHFVVFLCRPSWFRTSTVIPKTVRRRPTLLAVSYTFVSNPFLFPKSGTRIKQQVWGSALSLLAGHSIGTPLFFIYSVANIQSFTGCHIIPSTITKSCLSLIGFSTFHSCVLIWITVSPRSIWTVMPKQKQNKQYLQIAVDGVILRNVYCMWVQ